MRPTEQTMKCLERDLDWLIRIRKRATGNVDRAAKVYAKVIDNLAEVIDLLQAEVDTARATTRRRTPPVASASRRGRSGAAAEGRA